MDNLPIPKLRSSWVASLINTVLLFIVYYVFLFNPILNKYRSYFDLVDFKNENNIGLLIWAYIPEYSHPSSPTSAFIYIKNIISTPYKNIRVQLVTNQSELDGDKQMVIPPKLQENVIYQMGEDISVLAPNSITIIRIPMLVQYEQSIEKIIIIGEDGYYDFNAEGEAIVGTHIRSLTHNFIEIILLPPWSKGVVYIKVLKNS